jgi:hypothetical protein
MEDILQQISELNLDLNEFSSFKNDVIALLNEKHKNIIVNKILTDFNLNNLNNFNMFKNVINANLSMSLDGGILYTLEIPTKYNSSTAWETYIWIYINETYENITNIVYQTDRYARYDYEQREEYPDGEFQGRSIEEVYKTNLNYQTYIKSDIAEIKRLCDYVFA